ERRAANEPHRAGGGVPARVEPCGGAGLDRGVREVAEIHARMEPTEAIELVVAHDDVRGVDRRHDAGQVAQHRPRGQRTAVPPAFPLPLRDALAELALAAVDDPVAAHALAWLPH